MFVHSLDIKEFRGIKSCKNPIKFSNFTVLLGKNNSGKSAILEALSLLPNPSITRFISNKRRIEYLQDLHKFRRGSPYRSLLYLYAGESILHYNLDNKDLSFEIRKDGYFVGGVRDKLSIANFFNVDINQLDYLVLFFPYTTSILDDLEWKMNDLKDMITKKGYHITLAKFLNECVNDNYTEIVFQEPISLRKVYPNTTAFIELKDLGSGAEKVIKIMALLELFEPRLILIDDIEAGLHPTMIKLFFKWLKNKKFQSIIATHSIDVLYYLVDLKLNDTNLLLLNKSNEDLLSYKVLNLEELEDLLDANTDPRLLLDALQI